MKIISLILNNPSNFTLMCRVIPGAKYLETELLRKVRKTKLLLRRKVHSNKFL